MVKVCVLPLGGVTDEVTITLPPENVAVLLKEVLCPAGPVNEPLTDALLPGVTLIEPVRLAVLLLGNVTWVLMLPVLPSKVLLAVTVTFPAGVARVTVVLLLRVAWLVARTMIWRIFRADWAWTEEAQARVRVTKSKPRGRNFMVGGSYCWC